MAVLFYYNMLQLPHTSNEESSNGHGDDSGFAHKVEKHVVDNRNGRYDVAYEAKSCHSLRCSKPAWNDERYRAMY